MDQTGYLDEVYSHKPVGVQGKDRKEEEILELVGRRSMRVASTPSQSLYPQRYPYPSNMRCVPTKL